MGVNGSEDGLWSRVGLRGRDVDMEGREIVLLLLLVRGDNGGYRGTRRHVGVDKVGASSRAAHGPGGSIVS